MTNQEFAETNEPFLAACEKVKLPPTKRQAGKWRRRIGKAWKERNLND